MTAQKVFLLVKQAFREWNTDKAARLAAALAFYTITSLAPLLMVVIFLVNLVYRDGSASEAFIRQLGGSIGANSTDFLLKAIAAGSREGQPWYATALTLATMFIGASGVFIQLKDSLNSIWGIEEARFKGLRGMMRLRGLSLTMVLGIGFLLLVSLILSTLLTAALNILTDYLGDTAILAEIINQIVSLGLITVLFAMMFKFLPDTNIQWGDVWIGAFFTAVLFSIGKYLIGLYLGNTSLESTYGAAGSVLVLLLWVYYSAQILLFGAEFTQVYSHREGSRPPSGKHPTTLPETLQISAADARPVLRTHMRVRPRVENEGLVQRIVFSSLLLYSLIIAGLSAWFSGQLGSRRKEDQ